METEGRISDDLRKWSKIGFITYSEKGEFLAIGNIGRDEWYKEEGKIFKGGSVNYVSKKMRKDLMWETGG